MESSRRLRREHASLNDDQIYGIRRYGLTLQQVQTPNFGYHTIQGMINLVNQGRANDYYTAFDMLSGLNADQTLGLVDFGLTRPELAAPNFGEHTLEGIRELRQRNQNLTIHQAFFQVHGLTAPQTVGVANYGLTHRQVSTENFGQHTMMAMDILVSPERNEDREVPLTYQEAFDTLSGLDEQQTRGISRFRLARQYVTHSSFGEHTLTAMQDLVHRNTVNNNQDYTLEDAFRELRGLNVAQTRGVVEFQLNREQVMHGTYSTAILDAMRNLQRYNRALTGEALYNFTMRMDDYQVRGLNVFGITPEQLGIRLENNELVQFDAQDHYTISGRTIDAAMHMMETEGMHRDTALQLAQTLNTTQVVAMLNYGLTSANVQSAYFQETSGILSLLIDYLQATQKEQSLQNNEETEELDFPLIEEHVAIVRNAMETSLLEEFRTQRFLENIANHDLLGVFDGLLENLRSQTGNNNNDENAQLTNDAPQPPQFPDNVPNIPVAAAARATNEDESTISRSDASYNLAAFMSPISQNPAPDAQSNQNSGLSRESARQTEDERKMPANKNYRGRRR